MISSRSGSHQSESCKQLFPWWRGWVNRCVNVSGGILPLLESIPKLVETRVTSGRSGCGMSLAIGMDDPEFLLNRGTERREVAIAE